MREERKPLWRSRSSVVGFVLLLALTITGLALAQAPQPAQDAPPTVVKEEGKPPDLPLPDIPALLCPGPDPFGYTCGSAAFQFVDISATGANANISCDDCFAGPLPLGFTFNFYGADYTSVFASSNGFLSFGSGSTSLSNQCQLPSSTTPNNLIAVVWDDLDLGNVAGQAGYYQSFASCPVGGGQCFIFQWKNAQHYPSSANFDFEVILYANGNIVTEHPAGNPELGSGSTTGIENSNGSVGITFACNTANSLPDNSAAQFTYPSVTNTPTPSLTPTPGPSPTPTFTPSPTNTPTPSPTPGCSGVPDPGGYLCDDTVARAWITATFNTGMNGDDQVINVTLPFTFTFYGVAYNAINISSNGNAHFGTASTAFTNTCLPNATLPNGVIAPFWDDLYLPGGGGVYTDTTGAAPNRVFTIEWRDVPHFGPSPSGVTFQVQLVEGSNDIYALYLDTDFGDPAFNDGVSATAGIENDSGGIATQHTCNNDGLTPGKVIWFQSPSFTFPLATTGLSDIGIPVDPATVLATEAITDAESLAVYIETQGGTPFGSVQQLLKWDAFLQNFLAWSHEFGFGDNFAVNTGDYIFLLTNGGPTSVTFTGRRPDPNEVHFALAAGQSQIECALNFITLPVDHPELATADQLSDNIGIPDTTVVQALDWDVSIQNFLAWANVFGFGDNFDVRIGNPYIVCLDNTAPAVWP